MDPILERYQALEDKVASYTPNLDTKRLYEAFTYADTEHHGQLRKSGEPYIIHPLAVADIVADLGLDVDSVIAALLHDCIEDTGATHEEIAKKFGTSVADLVEGVTKLTRVQYVSKEEEQMENLRKMLMAMAHDIRVILIKICDRLHNMRTMDCVMRAPEPIVQSCPVLITSRESKDRKSTRLNSSHTDISRMPSSA